MDVVCRYRVVLVCSPHQLAHQRVADDSSTSNGQSLEVNPLITKVSCCVIFFGLHNPFGWTVLQNAFADDAFVTVPIASTIIMGTSRTAAYVGSNAYITFGAGSIVYSSISTTNPPNDKFMFNVADRGYMRVAYTTGSK